MTHAIPNEALDDRLGWIGMTGSGKTFGAGTCVERILAKRLVSISGSSISASEDLF